MGKKNFITDQVIHADALESLFHSKACGAVVTFCGKVRNHDNGKTVTGLSYEAYPPMAERVFDQIAVEAINRFGVEKIRVVHRVGDLQVSDVAVWIGVQSEHRHEAFEACRYVIDEIKKRAPIWKKEHDVDGKSEWVMCTHQ